MINKKAIIAGFFMAFVILATSIYTEQLVQVPESPTLNTEIPPTISLEAPSIPSQVRMQTLEFSESGDNIVCDKPPKDNKYGGISGSENKSPKGTTITEPKIGNRATATGVCGTYWYIAGWWFNASEMANLPSDTIMYGASPYTTSGGPGGSTTTSGNDNPGNDNPGNDNPGNDNPGNDNPGNDNPGNDNPGPDDGEDEPGNDDPVVPIPEVATFVLVALGIFGFVAWRNTRK